MLIATKGSLVADDTLLGKTGPDVGNSVLVARLLHVVLFAFRSTGVVAVRNDPYDARVRRLYEDMGFVNGEQLPLDDAAALTKAFSFIERAYQHESIDGRLSLATPPLPL
jgi:hypothetical protein